MSSNGENLPFDAAKAKLAMGELMKTPEGREIAEKIKSRLRELDVQFQGLTDTDKKEFMSKFKGKFSETFDDLRESIKKNVIDDDPNFNDDDLSGSFENSSPFQNNPQPFNWLFIFALLVIVFVIG